MTDAFLEGPLEAVRFLGLGAGPRLVVLGAVHGNEGCGPAAIARAIAEIRRGEVLIRRGEVTFVPVVNAKARFRNAREGDRNLNRDLREKPVPGDYEDRLGNRLCALLRANDVLLDLHSFTAPGEPFVFFGPEDNQGGLEPFAHARAELAFAASLGPSLLIHGWLDAYAGLIAARGPLGLPPLSVTEGFGTTEFMRFAGGYGVTLECGRHDDPAAPDIGHRAIRNALAQLGLTDEPAPAPAARRIVRLDETLICETPGDRIEGRWTTGEPVAAGALLARRADGTPVTARRDGVIVFPNADPKPGDCLCHLGVTSGRRA